MNVTVIVESVASNQIINKMSQIIYHLAWSLTKICSAVKINCDSKAICKIYKDEVMEDLLSVC